MGVSNVINEMGKKGNDTFITVPPKRKRTCKQKDCPRTNANLITPFPLFASIRSRISQKKLGKRPCTVVK